MSVFPLNIVVKEDTQERLLALASVPEKNKFLADDQNEIVDALKELDGRLKFIADTNGLVWQVTKYPGNDDGTAFESNDKIEAFIDVGRTHYIEGKIMGPGFTGVADLDTATKFFQTNEKRIRS